MMIEKMTYVKKDKEDVYQARIETVRRRNAFKDVLGKAMDITVDPYKPQGIGKHLEHPTVVAIYPTYLLLNNGRYNYAASKTELCNNEMITI